MAQQWTAIVAGSQDAETCALTNCIRALGLAIDAVQPANSGHPGTPIDPKVVRSTALSLEKEAAVVAFQRHTQPPLGDCNHARQPSRPVGAAESR